MQQQFDRVQNPSTIGCNRANSTLDLRELFEERLRRPLSSVSMQNISVSGLPPLGRTFHFELDAELIVYGTTEPNAHVTLARRAGSTSLRRNVHRPLQPARLSPDHSRGGCELPMASRNGRSFWPWNATPRNSSR